MTAALKLKSQRIDLRATATVKQLFQDAALAQNKNVSDFLLDAGIIAANEALANRHLFLLNAADWASFQEALDRPVQAKPHLEKLLNEPGLLG